MQYVEGRGNMRLYTDPEVEAVRRRLKRERERQPEGIRRYSTPPPRRRVGP